MRPCGVGYLTFNSQVSWVQGLCWQAGLICTILCRWGCFSFNLAARSSSPISAWAMNSRRQRSLTPWMFQPPPQEGNAGEWLLGLLPLKRKGQPICPPALHRKTWLMRPTAALPRQVGSCHLQGMHFRPWPSLISVTLDTCSGCFSASTHPHGHSAWEKVSSRSAQGYSRYFHHWRSLFQIRAVINLLSVSCKQSANLQGSSQRDVMGVRIFIEIQSTLRAHEMLFRAS